MNNTTIVVASPSDVGTTSKMQGTPLMNTTAEQYVHTNHLQERKNYAVLIHPSQHSWKIGKGQNQAISGTTLFSSIVRS